MTEPYRRYTRELAQRARYRATWLPNAPLRLGDVGVLDGELFDGRTSLSELGVETRQRTGAPMDLSFASEDGVDISFSVPGDPTAAQVEFGSAGAFVFQATGCVETQLDDLDTLTRALVAIRDLEERWQPEWVLVDTVVRAARATIMVAESSHASVTLSLDAAAAKLSSLVPSGSATVRKQSGEVFHIVGARAITPLYRVRRFKRSFVDWLRGRKAAALARASSPLNLRAEDVFEPAASEAERP